MSSVIKIKRSGNSVSPASLGSGELAYSWATGVNKLYLGTGTETAGEAANIDVIGGKYFTDIINAATASNTASTLVLRDASGNFSAGSITASLNGNASTASAWVTPRNLSLTGDATGTFSSVTGSANVSAAVTLATVNSNVGTFGSTTAIPVVTVNAKGLVTAISTSTISTTLSIQGDSGTDTVALGTDTLDFEGGTGVATSVTNNKVVFSIGQAVGTTSNVTFNDVTVSGNLTVQGTTTIVNSTTVDIADKNITLAKNATTAAEADGGGITLAGAGATINYSSTSDRWVLNKNLEVSQVIGNASTASAWQTARNLSLTGDATATLSSVNGAANVSATITLATVNSNVGEFGDSVTVPTVTVNAKGLVTAISETAIPTATTTVKGLASFSATQFNVASGAVSITTIDGGTY